MAKEKDPAFLFYPKDWLQGTSMLMPEEKGVYIDLLAHQHQDGAIPSDTKRLARMAGLSHEQFLPIWDSIKSKFRPAQFGYLVNQKLTNVVNSRIAKSRTKTITGTLASVIRLSTATFEQKEQIKKMFNINQFLETTDQFLNQEITTWFKCRLKDIENANISGYENGIISLGSAETFSFDADTPLPALALEATEMNQFTHTKKKNTEFVKEQWRTFLVERMNDPPAKKSQYKTITDLTSYFFNWMRGKFPNNATATHKQFSGNGVGKAGTSEARTKAAKDF